MARRRPDATALHRHPGPVAVSAEFPFWRELAVNVLGGVVAGLIVIGLGYKFIDSRVRLKERVEEQRRNREGNDRRRDTVLRAVLAELETNAAALKLQLKVIGEDIIFPLFSVRALSIALGTDVYVALSPETARALTLLVDRLETTGEMHAMLWDMSHGATAILAAVTPRTGDVDAEASYQRFGRYRGTRRMALASRLRDAGPYLYSAIDAVELELGIVGKPPAAQRGFDLGEVERVEA